MNRKTMVIAIGILLAFCIGIHFYAEWNMAQFDASLPKPPDPKQAAHAESQEEPDLGPGLQLDDNFIAIPPAETTLEFTQEEIEIINDAIVQHEDENSPFFVDFTKLPERILRKIFNKFYTDLGLEPPPPGYDYVWEDIEVPYIDENGNHVLRKQGEPIVEVKYGIGFAPTPEELERYQQLDYQRAFANADGNTAEAEQLLAEIEQLKASAQRERPLGASYIWGATTTQRAAEPDKGERLAREKYHEALREYGLEHIIDVIGVGR